MAKNNHRRAFASTFLVFALAFSLAGRLDISREARAQEFSTSPAPATQAANKIELHQALLDLTNPWTVMCIAAHPDDEDGTSLIVMRRKYGAHTVSLFSTFGEGGQNAIGSELYEELGAIRARETMAAAEIQGSEPHFLGLKDFGFSKSADEAFRVWGHDEALRRMVLEIRRLRPDVIITNHSATNNDHGHHQATARLELEAFDAAADLQRFPEQLKDAISAWQVQRLFVRVGRSNQTQTETAPVVTIDPNERDATTGQVYAEQALEALQQHATQGPWPKTVAQMAARFTNSSNGSLPIIRYRLVREAKGAEALPKDSHNFLDGLRLPEDIAKQLQQLTIDNHSLVDFIDQPDQLLDALLKASKADLFNESKSLDDYSDRFLLMGLRLNTAVAQASGISFSVKPRSPVLVPNTTSTFAITVSNKGTREASISGTTFDPKNIHLDAGNVKTPSRLAPKATINLSVERKTPADSQITVPLSAHLYDANPFGDPIFTAVRVDIGDAWFGLFALTHVDVAPPVEIASITPSPVVLTPASFERVGVKTFAVRPTVFSVKLINHQSLPFKGNLSAASGVADNRAHSLAVRLAPGENKTLTMAVSPPAVGLLTFTVGNGKVSSPPKQVPVVTTLAHVAPNLRVGYVRGFDFSLPNALAALGVESKELTVDDVKTTDLQKYSTIIVDNRVYESQPGLIAANQKLLNFAKDGGTLIVFYHKSFEWNPDERRKRPQLAPYKLMLGDERITDETAPITFIEPQHPLLNFPNKIAQEDFANWIQERGLYYPKDWDPQYHALLQSNDPGEAPLKGGLLVADYGRGHYIYTSMVWYRELRAGVPGAYRMFANMISYGHK